MVILAILYDSHPIYDLGGTILMISNQRHSFLSLKRLQLLLETIGVQLQNGMIFDAIDVVP